MKIAILETGHFQYALTQSEIFEGCEKIFFTPTYIRNEMLEYSPELCNGKFYMIENIAKAEKEIIGICNSENIDLLLISPVFDSYKAVLSLIKNLNCRKIITTHNINTWFNGRFWSPNSLIDRIVMRNILNSCDFIAVEDFIYAHLKKHNQKLFNNYKFLYIPFTIFHERTNKIFFKEDEKLKIVLTGGIDIKRRRYEVILSVINYFAVNKANITFSFAGKAVGEYGIWVQKQLDKANELYPGVASYFSDNVNTHPELFRKEMETADLVLSTSNITFKGMGTTEYIGKTKPTAAIHDMISFELPGLLPVHLEVPENLTGSVFNYTSIDSLKNILSDLIDNPQIINLWKRKAKENSRHFTANEIRKMLPLFHTK